MSAVTCLWFAPEDAEGALALYESCIPGFKIVTHRHLDGTADNPAGACDVWDIQLAGTPYQVMGAAHAQPFGMAMSISLRVRDQADLDAVWDAFLAAGGKEIACSWIADPYGVMWQIAPDVFFDAMAHGTQEQAQRVAEACWRMVRIDVAAIEDAYRG